MILPNNNAKAGVSVPVPAKSEAVSKAAPPDTTEKFTENIGDESKNYKVSRCQRIWGLV